ncbi:MAG: bifunctional aspartate transaminase/aspartate 4-decarboxylase [Bacteroidales bacterium]|nr:bifunctional aspartate transaminase/aspartate 4-decarboxylase [Bacteroidales bacterium]
MDKDSNIRNYERKLEAMSPFEIKNTLIDLAQKEAKASAATYLNAGRGNPNWIATAPRDAFFLLGMWAMEEARDESYSKPGVAGVPSSDGIGERLRTFLRDNSSRRGAHLLSRSLDYCQETLGIDIDSLAAEWANGIIGAYYPTPPRILENTEKIVGAYMAKEMGNNASGLGKEYDYFATEGGTAAMVYIFESLQANHLLAKGDTIALMTPIFTPYIEIPRLDRYDFNVIEIHADAVDPEGYHTWQYSDSELDKLRDRNVKMVFLVNPSNPPSYRMSDDNMRTLVDIVRNDNPNLMIVTDDVYGTFAKDFRSLMYILPENTLCVYSYSKYFGATGWRLAVVAAAKENVFDRLISGESETEREDLRKRYSSLSLQPDKIKFIDRMVADSRAVALNHTAGLSTPQQIQMSLFSLMCLLDSDNEYKKKMMSMISDRLDALWKGTGFTLVEDPMRVGYYSEIDLMVWGKKIYGEEFCKWLADTYESLDVVIRLARETGVVLLNGSGFDGPEWSVRASLANLDETDYLKIGTSLRKIFDSYHQEFLDSKK